MATAEGEDALWRGAGRRDVQCFVSGVRTKKETKKDKQNTNTIYGFLFFHKHTTRQAHYH
jgi:hypothetical protein